MITRPPRIAKKKRDVLFKAFVLDTTAAQASSLAKVSRVCANRYFKHWREHIYMHLRLAPRFAGDVEIDQSFFGGRGKKKMAALVRRLAGLPASEIIKRGKKLRPDRKVQAVGFRMRGGPVYVHLVKRADTATLMPLIRLVVEQGSTIYTDEWQAFNKLKLDGYKHETINHSLEYSDKKGRHINGIENFWGFCKVRMAKFHGIARTTLPLHIKECEFRYNHRDDFSKALKSVLFSKGLSRAR